jgi:two-component system sensor histidine kinase AlgZ
MHGVTGNSAVLHTLHKQAANRCFLPDFCRIRTILTLILLGELFSFVLVITKAGNGRAFWDELALVSLFVQWVGLSSASLLCVTRLWLCQLNGVLAGVISYVLVLLVTGIATGLAAEALHQPLHWQLLVQNLGIAAIVTAVLLRYFYLQHQWKERLRIEAQARLQALQSQIRPHFLFNSMNTIASLTRSQPALAEAVVEDLADLFRACLTDFRIPSTLQEELVTCRQYLRIEELRFGNRLSTVVELDQLPADALLPKLSLQPLIENAIYHGIEPSPEGGTVRIGGQRENDRMTIVIENSLPKRASVKPREGNRIAQENVRQRLETFFGGKVAIKAICSHDHYQLTLCIPVVTHVS